MVDVMISFLHFMVDISILVCVNDVNLDLIGSYCISVILLQRMA